MHHRRGRSGPPATIGASGRASIAPSSDRCVTFIPMLVVAAALLLSGCVSRKEQRLADERQCAGYGFTVATDAFANCMMNAENQRETQRAADREAEARRAAQASAMSAAAPFGSPPAEPSPDASKMKCRTVENTVNLPDGSTRTTSSEKCSSSSFSF